MGAPAWVDLSKPPGYSKMPFPDVGAAARNVVILRNFFYAPPVTWCAIALMVHITFPYDIEAAKVWRVDWVLHQFAVNFGVYAAYAGFWSVSLNVWGWGERKFRADHTPTDVYAGRYGFRKERVRILIVS